jgi:hypothetical protein
VLSRISENEREVGGWRKFGDEELQDLALQHIIRLSKKMTMN